MEDYDKIVDNPQAVYAINEAKKAYKRSQGYKATLIPRSNLTREEMNNNFSEAAHRKADDKKIQNNG